MLIKKSVNAKIPLGGNMINCTILTRDNFFDSSSKLEILKKRGVKAAINDFAILLGGYVSDSFYVDHSEKTLSDRTGWYWTKTDDGDNDARVVN